MGGGGQDFMKAGGGEKLDNDSRRAGAGLEHGSRRAGLDKGIRRGGTR